MALVPDAEWKAWVLIPMISGGATIAFPALNSTLSKRSHEHHQGTALGIGNGLSFLGRVAGPIAGGTLFDMFSPGTPYLVITGLGIIAVIWAVSEMRSGRATSRRRCGCVLRATPA